jgi:hypothetical protein
VRGKLISEALRTEHGEPITDRKIAERQLKAWVESVEGGMSATGTPQTLETLIERYRQTKAGLKEKTRINVEWTIKNLLKRWTLGTDKRIREFRVSDIDAMLASIAGWTPRTFNTFTMFLRQMFQVAGRNGYSSYDLLALPKTITNIELRSNPTECDYGGHFYPGWMALHRGRRRRCPSGAVEQC